VALDIKGLEDTLGYQFRDDSLLELALTHPSIAHEQEAPVKHNQRLEFLGDSVLGLVLTRELFDRFPELEEGPLTKARAHLVNQRMLCTQARRLGLGEYLILSRGEMASGGRDRASSLADAFEAIIGAIFVDGGYVPACEFVLRRFHESLAGFKTAPTFDNPKGELQEFLQSQSSAPLRYEVTKSTGPDHDRCFECAVFHDGNELGRGIGKSKRAAETAAALKALETLREQMPATVVSDAAQ
jgi:ribonuclease III